MSTIQDTPTVNQFASYGTPSTAKSAADDVQDRFLKLLVTQMKNQDPLNPMDNAQVTTQLAQLSTVNGIKSLNTPMQSLASSLISAQGMQSAALIGRSVIAEGSGWAYNAG